VTGVQLWSLRFAGAPTGSHHFAGGAMDVPLPPLPIRWSMTREVPPQEPKGFALWGARRGWAQIGSGWDQAWQREAQRRARLFGWRANVLAAARYIRERYGKPWTGWPVHAHYSDPRLQQRLSRMTLAERARRHRVLEAINETGRGAEEVQWAWPSS
jgi:hypothetical protein